jgi:putative ABC transport system permease protein
VTFASLVVRDLLRNPLRTSLTVVAGAVGVLAFVFLQTVVDLFYLGAGSAQVDRLIVRSSAGFTQPLPLAYRERIAAVPGVSAITHQGWFGGRISERPDERFPNFVVESESFLDVYDEYLAPPEQLAAWKADPCGAAAGRDLAERMGWKVGDRVVLQGSIFPGEWALTIRAIYGAARPGTDTTVLAFGYRCVNEKVPEERRNMVGIYTLRVDDPGRSGAVAAQIDAMFANSPYQTRTESERAFQLGFVAMASAILVAVQTVSGVILAIILLIVANTLALGVREKTVDLATLKAMGFRSRHLLSLVLWEALAIGVLAAALGIALAPAVVRGFVAAVEGEFGGFPDIQLQASTLLLAAALAVAVALLAALVPALRAARLSVVDGLRKVA